MIATWWTDATTRHRRREAARLTHIAGVLHRLPRDARQPIRGLQRTIHSRTEAACAKRCRNRHDYDYTDFTRQSPRAQNMHATFVALHEKTCIDSHKGIVYRLPDLGLLANP